MKQNIKYLFIAICGLASVACNNDLPEERAGNENSDGKWTLGTDTKTTRVVIGDASEGIRALKWEEDDELTVFNATTEAIFTLSSGHTTTSGVFKSESEDLENSVNYYAFHSKTATTFTSGAGLTVTMPSPMEVTGTMDEFVSDHMVLLSNVFQFTDKTVSNLYVSKQTAALELHLKLADGQADKTISTLKMVSPVADYFVASATYDGEGATAYTYADEIEVSFATPLTLSADEEATVKLVVWMNPAITEGDLTDKNFAFNFFDASNNKILELSKPAVLLEGGKYYNTPSQVPAARRVRFVKADGTGTGTSWDDAMSEADITVALRALNDGQAGVLSPGDTVCLAAGTYKFNGSWSNTEARVIKKLTIIGGFPANATGDNVKITYPSADKTIISGDRNGDNTPNAGDVRAFSVRDGATVVLKGIDITGGAITQYNGAGLSVEGTGSTLKMYHCKVYGNENSGGSSGGGVYVQNGTTLYCENTEISNNTQTQTHSGGIYIDGANAKATLKDCKVSGNSSGKWGAGIFVNHGTLICEDTEISGNSTTGFDAGAGTGGVHITGTNSNVQMKGCVVKNNTVHGPVGGIRVEASCTLYCEDTEIIDNTSGGDTGGLHVFGANALATLKNCKVSDNSATKWVGGIFVDTGKLICEGTEISGNKTTGDGTYCGGVRVNNAAVAEMDGCVVKDNIAISQAGGILVEEGTLHCQNTQITGNKASSRGGAIQMTGKDATSGSKVYLESCYIAANQVAEFGSALHVMGNTSLLYMANTTVTKNIATSYGGALNFSLSSNPRVLASCTIADNIQNGTNNQGIDIRCETNTLSMINCVVTNSATDKNSFFIKAAESFTSDGYNVLGITSGTITPGANADNTAITYADMFGTNVAADNGGPTPTIMPTGTYTGASVAEIEAFAATKFASPAYAFDFAKDQRGTARNAAAATPGACEKE